LILRARLARSAFLDSASRIISPVESIFSHGAIVARARASRYMHGHVT
jgi:hypothetical protein